MATRGLIFTGARARFTIDGVPFSFATNVAGSEEIQRDAVEILNNIEVQEHVPIAYRVTLTASKVWFVNETLKSLGWFPKNGSNPGEHLTNILNTNPFAGLIQDTQTNDVFMQYDGLEIASYNWTIAARAIVATDVTFVGIKVRDRSEV